MKSNMFLLAIAMVCTIGFLQAQESPKPPAPPPAESIIPPAPPKPPVVENEDTTRISLGDKQILIINKKSKKDPNEQTEAERELEDQLDDVKDELEAAKREIDEEKLEMEREKQNMELEVEKQHKGGKHNENKAPGEKRKYKTEKKNKSANVDFIDIDLGVNFLKFGNDIAESTKDDLKLKYWGSWSTTFTFLPTKIYLGTPNLMLMTGFGWRIGQFEFKEKLDFEPNQTLLYAKFDNIKKSQFVIHQLQIPLSVYVQSNKIRGLGRIGAGFGGYAGLLIHQELETDTEKPKRSIETEEDFGFEDFRYGLSARIDVGALKLFANMDMNDLWKDHDIRNIECGLWFDF
ncbi:MAG: hypothetical protein WBO44_01290 [Saprospiraceae bacterium]